MSRLRLSIRRIRSEGFTPKEFRTICVAALVLLGAIVVSGGAVRLTGSGLGCVDWPQCNGERFIDVSSKHSAIENVNRLFTFLVCIGVALAAVAAWYRRPRRRDLLVLSLVMLVGVPAQGVVGAVVVWTHVNPFAVSLHFLLSMVLVWVAVTMLVRSGEPEGRRRPAVVPRVRNRVRLLAMWTTVVVFAGVFTTGTGPHAGDEQARRFFGTATDIDGTALVWVTRLHAATVWIALATALSLLWMLRRRSHDRQALDAPLTAWLITGVVQGAIGYTQYAAGLPSALVAVHMAGATVLVGMTAWLWNSTSSPAPTAGEMVDEVLRRRGRRRLSPSR